jgi:glycosyltransferase involved in cell wall biosynthesis
LGPLVSVIIPAFNCANCIASAIESVLGQTYGNIELIVVDDGSTDHTADLVRDYRDRLKYIRQENGGVSRARNTGIEAAEGTFIAFLDADDVWEKNKLEIQMHAMMAHADVDLVHCRFRHMKNGKVVPNRTYEDTFNFFKEYELRIGTVFGDRSTLECGGERYDFYRGNIYRHLFLGNFILPSSVLFRKESLTTVGRFDEQYRVAEETEFFLRFSRIHRIGFIDLPLLKYEMPASDNLSGKKNTERLIRAALRIQIDSLLGNYDRYVGDPRHFDRGISMTYCRLAYYFLSEHRTADSRKYAVYGMTVCPRNLRSYKIFLAALLPRRILEGLVNIKRWRSPSEAN